MNDVGFDRLLDGLSGPLLKILSRIRQIFRRLGHVRIWNMSVLRLHQGFILS